MGSHHSHMKGDIDPRLLEAAREEEFLFGEVVIFGAEKVGKTSVCHRFVHNYFTDRYVPTSGVHRYEVTGVIETDEEGRKTSLILRNSFRKSSVGRDMEHMKSIVQPHTSDDSQEKKTIEKKNSQGKQHIEKKDSQGKQPSEKKHSQGKRCIEKKDSHGKQPIEKKDSQGTHYRRVSRAYTIAVEQGLQHLKFTLVDTASDFVEMEPTTYRATINNAKGFLLVCSYDNADSLNYVEERYRDIKKMKVDSETPILIVANKCDLPEEEKVLDESQLTEFVTRLNHDWSDASVATEDGCTNMMQDMFHKIHLFAERAAFLDNLPEEYAYEDYED